MHAREVIVIGGGLAGLAAGISAAKAGARATVLEATSAVGGRARTRVEEGFCFNMGPHALYAKGAGMEVLHELGVEPEGAAPSQSGLLAFRAEETHALPTGFVSLLSTGLLELREKLEFGRLLARLPKLDPTRYDGVPLDAVLRELLRRPKARAAIESLVRLTTYTNAPERMCGGAALRQLQLATQAGVLYLHGGWQTLVEALRARADENGVKVETSARVRAVRCAPDGRFRVETGDETARSADAVVLALSPRDARRLVGEGDDPELARHEKDALPVRFASLDVGLRRVPAPRRTFALGVGEPTYVGVHSATARLAPEGGGLVHAGRYLAPDEAPRREALRVELEERLERLQPGWREQAVRVHFQPGLPVANALPRADSGGLPARPGPALSGQPGLYVAGDWVGPRGLLSDASLWSGREAGHAAAGARSETVRAA